MAHANQASLIWVSTQEGIARITLSRADARNALSAELMNQFEAAIAQVGSDPAVRVCVLAGEGKSFCAGMDLRGVMDDPKAMGEMLRMLARSMLALRRLRVPTVAQVQGAAIGGGCGLMVVCDFAVTHAEAKIGYPEVDLGISPAVVAPWLVQKIGAGAARAILLAGGTMTGAEAHARGMATHLVAQDELQSATDALVARLAAGGATAIATAKEWLGRIEGHSINEATCMEAAEISARIIAGPEAQERLRKAFGPR